MLIETLLSPKDLPPTPDKSRTGVVGIDCLRATSVMVAAMSVGVSAIVPVSSPEEARKLHVAHADWLLAGEVEGLPPEGFHFGNSPLEFLAQAERVKGKTVAMSTTNGTRLLNRIEEVFANAEAEHHIYIGANNNRQALCQRILADDIASLYICCAGQKGRIALEDVTSAGLMVQALLSLLKPRESEITLGDGAWLSLSVLSQFKDAEAAFRASKHGRELIEIGLEEDLAYCAKPDQTDVVPVYFEGRITVF